MNNCHGVIKFYNADKLYGFFAVEVVEGWRDVFFHKADMERFGFDVNLLKRNQLVSFSYQVVGSQQQITDIRSVEGQSAGDKPADKTSPAVTLDMFNAYHVATQDDLDSDQLGESVYEVINRHGDFVQYIVALDQEVLHQLGDITLDHAKTAIGIRPQVPVGPRQSGNVTYLSDSTGLAHKRKSRTVKIARN